MIDRAAGYTRAMAITKVAPALVHDQLASSTIKLSANVSADVGQRLREFAHIQRFSESSIVDVALKLFFARGDDSELGAILVELGATLRRRQGGKPNSNASTARAEFAEEE